MDHILDVLQQKNTQENFGRLDKEYVSEGMKVKVYSPDKAEAQRIKNDIQIREKIMNVVLESDCNNTANF